MKDNHLISIVVPAYNEENFIPECLASLKNQDFEGEYEIILVDNNSSDHSKEIAKKFGVRVLHCKQGGIFYARQQGANSASGDIIIQADADTVYPSNWLSKIDKHFSSCPQAVAVAGRFLYKDPPHWAGIEYFLRNFANFLCVILFKKPLIISGANFAFKKETFLKIDGYKKDAFSLDQYDIANRLSRSGKVVYDNNLIAFTSSRRVKKPFFYIFLDFLSNLSSIFLYFSKLFCTNFSRMIRGMSLSKIALTSVPIVAIIAVLAYGYFIPSSLFFGKVYSQGPTDQKLVALTFDDGPNEPYTSQILDILEKYNIKATFFLIGKNVQEYPETAKRIVADGDVIGNHSYSHDANHALTNEGCKDLILAQKIIFDITGVVPHLYRPPHGKKSPWEIDCLLKENLVETQWSDSAPELHSFLIFGQVSTTSIKSEIFEGVGPGKIILLHDGYGTCHNCKESDKSLTVKVLTNIIETLQNQGYKFVTVPELLDMKSYNN